MKISTFALEVLFLASVTKVLSVLRTCKDFVPPGEEKWYDTADKDCLWYRDGNSCEVFAGSKVNFGQDAASACCACGGGTRLETPVECNDFVPPGEEKWFEGNDRDCAKYENPTNYWWCLERGSQYENFGRTAREACCFCGGGVEGRQAPQVAAKKPFKIEDDGRGFADKLFEVLEPYIPVQVVPSGDAADLKVVWKEKNSPAKFLGFICDTRGLTIEWPFDTANPTRSFPQMIKEVLDELLVNEGKPKRCDAGYRYSGIEEISCCTAELLNTLDLSCSKGKKVNNPPCWSPPVTTPVSGKTKLVKVKILVNPQVKKRDWTEEKSLQELENANRLIAATSGIEDSVRFVMHGQNMERLILGTEAADVFDKLQVVAEAHPDEYDVLLYLTNQKTINEKGQQIGGRAEQGLCLADRPSVAYADPLGSYITVTHELAHVLGADHGQFGCTFPMIARSAINGFPDKDLGLTQCSANRIANELPKYTCLETAP